MMFLDVFIDISFKNDPIAPMYSCREYRFHVQGHILYKNNASLSDGQNVYLRGFGSFIVKERAEKTGRNISKNTAIIIPAHNILYNVLRFFINTI